MSGGQGLAATLGKLHLDLAGTGNAALAFDVFNTVFLEQEFDALGQTVNGFVLLVQHGRKVNFDAGCLDAQLGKFCIGCFEKLGGMQQRLGRDAAHVEAGAAEGCIFLDADSLHPELGCLNGSDIASGAGSNDNQVNIVMGGVVTSLE